MKLNFTDKGKLKPNMVDYVDNMVNDFPEGLSPSNYPWSDNLFKVDPSSTLLPREKKELFHTFVAKALFL
jgi:hypothetical protein